MKTMIKAYFGIKYYEDNRNKALIEVLMAVLRRDGIEPICMASDVEKWGAERLTLQDLMQRTFQEIDESDLVVLEMSEKGVGLGIEAGYAIANGKPLVVMIKRGCELSGTMQGIADFVITYSNPSEVDFSNLNS